MDNNWQLFFEKFPETVTDEQLPVKLPRFDLDLCDLAGAAADWCHQYLKDRKCPSDLIVFLTKKIINNLRVKWAAEPEFFGYRPEKNDYQALWLMRQVISKLNEVCLNHNSIIPYEPILTSLWWSSFVLKNTRRQMEDYIAVVPYLHTLFDIKDYGEASFYAVYDGHNGLDAAVYSSMYLHQHLVQSAHYPTNPEYALYEAFFVTDNGFTQKTKKYNLVSGTTAVCALLLQKKLYIGWVGDSIAMLWKNGTPLCLVNKHVPDRHDETKRIESEGGMITKCQGIWRVDGQLAVSRAIGDVKYKPHITCQPEIRALVLDGNEEFLVLGSDGLWEFTTPENVADTIYDELLEADGDVSGVSNKLVFKSKSQGSKDNISVITVFLQDPKQLVAKRRAAIMETAMELQRNATATLASYGQDAGDFGPETDVDTPDEPIGLTKPKAEGEANVIDESGEDSEEDGGGWNYYNKSTTEGAPQEEKTYKTTGEQQEDNKDNNSDAEDMDYKLNPDAPEFVPVSSPTANNHAQRFLMETDDFIISSSPQKYKETIDNVDVPDENDFTNEIKMQSADLSKLDNPFEPIDDSSMLNGIKPLNEEVTTNHNEIIDNFMFQNEQITNGNSDEYTNPFVSDEKVDLNKVQDLSEYINDDDQTNPTDVSMESSKNNEFNSTNCDNGLENESNVNLNDDLSIDDHMKYEQDMNSKNVDATNVDTTNVTVDSTLTYDDESFKHSDGYKNEFLDSNNIDKFGQYEDRKLNDSVSTTDAVLGSEPNTPMRMDNQSTFESENDDDQFSESFKQQLKFNQFDENNDKENHDPFCFEQTEDPAGIIPNVTHEVNEIVDETHNDSYVKSNNSPNVDQVSELNKHEPVEEPLCIKEKAKPIHLAYEQQYLPESDFSISTHEALLNTPETNVSTEHFEQQGYVESPNENELEKADKLDEQESIIPTHSDIIEQDNSDVDDVKDYIGLKQELYHDDKYDLEQEISNGNSVQIQDDVKSENEYVIDLKQESNTGYNLDHTKNVDYHNHDVDTMYHDDFKQEHNVVSDVYQDSVGDLKQESHDNISNNVGDSKYENQFIVEDIQKPIENIAEMQSYVEDFEQKHDENVSEVPHNYVEDLKHVDDAEIEQQNHVEQLTEDHNNILEIKNDYVENFKREHQDVEEVENNHIEDIKEEQNDVVEIIQNYNGDFKLDHHGVESVENHMADSDEEMHSSMIIHSDVENNMPQPYCSSHDTLLNEANMMCTSMTFEENFQNRNMNDSLYVMETSSDYFGEEIEQAPQFNKSVNETKADEQLPNVNSDEFVEPIQIENEIISAPTSELKVNEVETETHEPEEKIKNEEDSNKVSDIAIAAAVGTAAIGTAAIAATVSLNSKKSAPKKIEKAVSKAKTTTTKTTPIKPMSSKPLSPLKKTTRPTATSKPMTRPTTAPSTTSKPIANIRPMTVPSTTSKPTANVRPTIAPKTTTLKATTTITVKAATKPAVKTTNSTTRTISKTAPTIPLNSSTKTMSASPKTPTTLKTTAVTKLSTTPKTSTTPRTSTLISKQSLTNGSSKPLSRPTTAPSVKKPLSNGSTNGITKLTNGDVPKTSTTTKSPITLATRMSLAPPKLPPKVKAAPKTVTPPAMPGPIRRPNAPITKKTETATS